MNFIKLSPWVVSLILAGSAFGVTVQKQLTRDILCHGQNESTNDVLITVVGDTKTNTLSISRGEEDYNSQTLKVTGVIPMFPVYSIDAMVDHRPVDGALIIARLNIRNVMGVMGSDSNPAKLVIKTSSLRHPKEHVETFNLTCQFKNRQQTNLLGDS